MMINIIAAVARNRAIGYKNKLIYWLPNDMKRFRQLTTGHTIIMGRNTYLSLPKGALPNRRNVVLSRSAFATNCSSAEALAETLAEQYPGCDVYPDLETALASCAPDEDIYIIGGASVYQEAMVYANRLCLTEVDDTPSLADTFFPDYSQWKPEWREQHEADERHSVPYAFVDYVRQE